MMRARNADAVRVFRIAFRVCHNVQGSLAQADLNLRLFLMLPQQPLQIMSLLTFSMRLADFMHALHRDFLQYSHTRTR